ncbi:MAG: DUF1552 domain-containing protein, partial [Planctomycetota bacterium]
LESCGIHPKARAKTQSESAPRRLLCVGNHLGYWPGGFFPREAGLKYTTTPTLEPIDHLREHFTVFSNLDHGTSGGHSGVHAFLSGVRKEEAAGFPEKNRTLDQAAAEHCGSSTRFPSINAGLGGGTSLCWTRAGVCIPPINNPARLFEALFVDSGEAAQAKERVRLRHRSSVLDAIRESAKRTSDRLSASDRDKLDQYLTSVRDVERRVRMSQAWLDRPKPKSPIEPVRDEDRKQIEEIPLFFDLLALALQTDSTRVATFEIPLNFQTSELDVGSYHGLSHHSKQQWRLKELAVVEEYLLTQFGKLLEKLRDSKVLDQTLVVFGSGMGNGSTHSNRDLPVILAGGGLKHRGHVVCPSEDSRRVPLCNLWLSVLHWFGAKESVRFNRSTGTFRPMTIA